MQLNNQLISYDCAFWLLKSEPTTWSWQNQLTDNTTSWDGVRSYQARNYMQQMNVGDLAFFYHSNQQKAIVGIVKIIKAYYPDTSDAKFGNVNVATYMTLPQPITLHTLKNIPELQDFPLIKQSRLSVMPVAIDYLTIILQQISLTIDDVFNNSNNLI